MVLVMRESSTILTVSLKKKIFLETSYQIYNLDKKNKHRERIGDYIKYWRTDQRERRFFTAKV